MTLSKDDQGKKDIANSPYVSPDVYQTVKEMIDPVPERRRKNPPKKDRTFLLAPHSLQLRSLLEIKALKLHWPPELKRKDLK